MNPHLNNAAHAINDASYVAQCRQQLDRDGALVLSQFFTSEAIAEVIAQSEPRESDAYYAKSTPVSYTHLTLPTILLV